MRRGKPERTASVLVTLVMLSLGGVPLSLGSSAIAASGDGGSGVTMNGVQATSGTVSSTPYQVTISSFDAGAGSDPLLIVGVAANDANVASVTFGGAPLAQAAASFSNNDAEFWFLAGPSGAADIVVTMTGATSAVVGAYSFFGVNQTDPVPTTSTDHGGIGGSSPDVSIATQFPGSWVLDLPSIFGDVTLGSPSCTQQWDLNVPNSITGASSSTVVPAPSTVTCGWTASSGDLWDDVAVEIAASSSSTTTSTSTTSVSTSTTTTIAGQTSPSGHRFIRIRALGPNSGWALPGYDAQQVLSMISQLKPDVLERYTDGSQNPNAPVPVAPGSPPMTVGEFLNASMQACNCYIIPGASLNEYDKGTFFATAQSLLSLPVYPPFTFLSLDSWHAFSTNHTSDQVKAMFQQLYSQGWAGIGVNACGRYFSSYGYATFSDFCVRTVNWQPDTTTLASIRTEPNIKLDLLYIDFPREMQLFTSLSGDQEAQILTNNIGPAQSSDGFEFVYPVVQSFWDSNAHSTSGGASIYSVMQGMMAQYN